MSEVSQRYSTIAGGFTDRLVNVPSEAWRTPSPCTEWEARDIVVHVINTHHRVLSMLDGSEPAVVASDDDVEARWSTATGALVAALTDETLASKSVSGGSGEQSFETLVGRLLCADTLVHTSDLARATGQSERLDPGAVAKAMELLAPLDEGIRRPGGFAPKIEPVSDADEQTRLLNFCGRAV